MNKEQMPMNRPGGPLYLNPFREPDGVCRNAYGEPEVPKENVKNPEALEHFNNLVVKYYNFLKHSMKEDALRVVSSPESACRVLGLAEMPKSKDEINTAYRNLMQYAHPDKNRQIDSEKFTEACHVVSQKIGETKEILIKDLESK